MQNAPSTQSIKSTQQTKSSDVKTNINVASNDKTSSSTKKDDTKKPADNTDHTTVSTSFCGCKKDKCDAFFDKLLCYLEKQSDIIAKCCAHSREHRRGSCETLTQETRRPKDSHKESTRDNPRHPSPCKDDPEPNFLRRSSAETQRDNPRHPSPCKDDPEPNFLRRSSVETQLSLKGRSRDKCKDQPDDDCDNKPSRYKSQLDVGGRQFKVGDKPCNIYVEVCSCQKEGRRAHPTRSSPKAIEADSEQYSFKQSLPPPPQRHPSRKSNEYGFDCHGCENKVSYFFKLAEEICQGYMKQCQEQEPNRARSNHSAQRRNSREDFGNQVPSRPYQWNEGSDESYMKPEKLPANHHDGYGRPQVKPIAIEIDCLGTKEEIIVEPCQCVERCPTGSYERGRPTPVPSRAESHGPKKSCIEVFEERYGKILRDLHSKLFPDTRQTPLPGYPPQPVYPPPQGYSYPVYPNPYGDASPQQPPPQQVPLQQPPPQQVPPPQTPPPQQSPPVAPKQEATKESKQSDDDDSSDDRKKSKKKKDKKEEKKKKKKKESKDS